MPTIGLTPRGARGLVELDRAEQIAVVGERQRRHAVLAGPGHQLLTWIAPSSRLKSLWLCRWTQGRVAIGARILSGEGPSHSSRWRGAAQCPSASRAGGRGAPPGIRRFRIAEAGALC